MLEKLLKILAFPTKFVKCLLLTYKWRMVEAFFPLKIFWLLTSNRRRFRGDGGGGGGGRVPFFAITWVFCNCFEELQTVFIEIELIINILPLTYIYQNTIGTCLTPNHLLFGRQLLYSSNTNSTVVRNVTVLSSTADKINRISNHFLDRWRHEFTWDTGNIKIKYRLPKN